MTEKEGNLMINRVSFDPLTGRYHNRRIVIRDGVRKEKPFSIRLYNAQEMAQLLASAGLEVARLLGDFSSPLTARSRRLVVVGSKPERS